MIKALAETQDVTAEYGQEHTVSLFSNFQTCIYFTTERYAASNSSSVVQTIGLFDNWHLASIADVVMPNFPAVGATAATANYITMFNLPNLRQKIMVKGACRYTLRNQCTEPVKITAYYIKPRFNVKLIPTSGANLYYFLGVGFANNGLDPANANPSNAYMINNKFTPFDSFDFCKNFKIYKTKKLSIDPGRMAYQEIKGQILYRPADFVQLLGTANPTQRWNLGPYTYDVNRLTRFCLFQLEGQPAGFGSAQANYSKNIQMTTPTVIMDTKFNYRVNLVQHVPTVHSNIENLGIAPNGSTAPAIVVEGGDAVGVESDAF